MNASYFNCDAILFREALLATPSVERTSADFKKGLNLKALKLRLAKNGQAIGKVGTIYYFRVYDGR